MRCFDGVCSFGLVVCVYYGLGCLLCWCFLLVCLGFSVLYYFVGFDVDLRLWFLLYCALFVLGCLVACGFKLCFCVLVHICILVDLW